MKLTPQIITEIGKSYHEISHIINTDITILIVLQSGIYGDYGIFCNNTHFFGKYRKMFPQNKLKIFNAHKSNTVTDGCKIYGLFEYPMGPNFVPDNTKYNTLLNTLHKSYVILN